MAVIAAYSALAQPTGLKSTDVGTPGLPGSMDVASGKITVTGGGDDIWNAADSFHYAYIPVTGDFDYVIQVLSLTGNSGDGGWSKAELMARLPLDPTADPAGDDPHISNMVNRPASDNAMIDPETATVIPAGVNNRGPQWRAHRAGEGTDADGNAWTGVSSWTTPNPAYPPTFPNVWLRMERVGSVFYMYTSDDGKAWHMYNPYDPQGWDTAASWPSGTDSPAQAYFTNAWPAKINLGIAVTGHNGSGVAVAVVTNFVAYTPTPVAITTQPPATKAITASMPLEISVVATGDPVHYEWRKNGTAVPRQVGAKLSIPISVLADAGKYTCRVFGGGKEIMSSAREGRITTVSYTFPRPGESQPVAKESYIIRIGDLVCGVGFYK